MTSENGLDIAAYVKSKYGIAEQAKIDIDSHLDNFLVDIIIEDIDKNVRYYVDITQRANVESLAMFNLMKDQLVRSKIGFEFYFIIATKSISKELTDLANGLDIDVLLLPKEVVLSKQGTRSVQRPIKLTSEKSWIVVSGLIKNRSSSIRKLSLEKGVSYGWTHSTINNLIEHGIATRNGNQVQMADIDKLLNGIAWERSTQSLIAKEINLASRDVFVTAREISKSLDAQKIKHAFASYLAGTMYTGQSVRHDSLQIYLSYEDVTELIEMVGPLTNGEGIKLQIMHPDRELFEDSRTVEDIRVTSPSQTLLDLAGLGYKGKDLCKALVEIYGQL